MSDDIETSKTKRREDIVARLVFDLWDGWEGLRGSASASKLCGAVWGCWSVMQAGVLRS